MQKANKLKLAKRVVKSIEPDSINWIVHWDKEITGFCLRVYPSGKKTYFLPYRNRNKITRKIKISTHGQITA